MNFALCARSLALSGLLLAASPGSLPGADSSSAPRRLEVTGQARLTPIALTGFPTEVASVLKFDLELAGFKITAPDTALYTLTGTLNAGQVEGRLSSRSQTSLLARAYKGANLRRQAHALADDVLLTLTGQKGIAQTRIAFKAELGRTSEVYVADYDGHNAIQVTQDNNLIAAPTWAPGRGLLYYVSYKQDNPDIFYHDLASGKRAVVASYSGLNTSPAISSTGKLAMVLSKGGSPDIYIADLNGANLKQLTFTPEDESSPCWSPDGQWICYVAKVNERRSLMKVSVNGGPAHRIAIDGAVNPTEPDWSPDGKFIIFTCQKAEFELCLVPAAGGEATTLVTGEDPSWAPNSRNVVFTRRKNGRRYLSLLDVFTKHVKDVAQLSGNCSQPSWAK